MDASADFQSLLDNEATAPTLTRGLTLTGPVVKLDEHGALVDLKLKQEALIPRAEVEKLTGQGVALAEGQTVTGVVTNPNDENGHVVVALDRSPQQPDWARAEELLASGAIWEGQVSHHNRGGLLVQFGEIQGFVPASQIMDLPHTLPEAEKPERLKMFVGRTLGFKVVEVDRRRKRLVLSERKAHREYYKQQQASLFETIAPGQVRPGRITALREFGAFVDLSGADGLIHISEVAWQRVKHPSEVVQVGQTVEVEVLKVDPATKKIALSLKRRQPDPWLRVTDFLAVDQVCVGPVTRVVNFGAFVDLGQGIEGLLHASRWAGLTLAEGDRVRVKILRIEPDRQRVSLALEAKESPPSAESEPPPPPAERETPPPASTPAEGSASPGA